MKEETCPCSLCGQPTPMLATKLCNRCWELEKRITADPDIAQTILDSLCKPTREELLQSLQKAKRDNDSLAEQCGLWHGKYQDLLTQVERMQRERVPSLDNTGKV